MAERPGAGQVPGKERQAEDPENCEDAVRPEIWASMEAAEEVESSGGEEKA